MKFSILVPCYNEELNLNNLVERMLPICVKANVEVILIENGSKDNSREIFRENIEGKYESIKVVYVQENKGYGYGIQQGIKAATGDYIGWIHADLQIPPEVLIPIFELIENNADNQKIFVKGHRIERPVYERIFTYGQAVFTSLMFRKKLYDIGAVPMVFEKSLISDVELLPNDFAIDIFLYREALLKNFKVIRYDVKMEARDNGESTWNRGLKTRLRHSIHILNDNYKIVKGEKIY